MTFQSGGGGTERSCKTLKNHQMRQKFGGKMKKSPVLNLHSTHFSVDSGYPKIMFWVLFTTNCICM